MIVTVCGTQCIGKSTFIRDFKEKYTNFVLPEIDYRKVIEKNNLKLNRNGDLFSQSFLYNFVLNDLNKAYKDKMTNYILDRGILDALCYTTWHFIHNKDTDVTYDAIQELEQTTKININKYDRIFYIPLEKCNDIPVVDDKFRDTDLLYRKQIDDIFKKYIDQFDIYVEEIYGTPEQRLQQAIECLGGK